MTESEKINLTKKAMGYVSSPPNRCCDTCCHVSRHKDPVGSMYDLECVFSKIVTFPVVANAVCDHWEAIK